MPMKLHQALTPDALYHACAAQLLPFESTTELAPLLQPLGQRRALEAIEFGVDMWRPGFNLFLLGEAGLGKHALVQQILQQRAAAEAPPSDWCYVNNFDEPQKPLCLQLPAGLGRKLGQDMERLVEDLLTSLPSSFQSEEYRNRRQELEDEFQERQEAAFRRLDKEATERGIAVMRTPNGYTLGPVVEKKLLGPDEFAKLPQPEQDRIEKLIAEIQLELQAVIRDMPLLQREHHQRLKALNNELTLHTVEQLIAWIENEYRDHPQVMSYLAAVKKSTIENAQDFLPSQDTPDQENMASRVAQFHEYSINVIVDSADAKGAPIIYDDNPTYQNLVGRVEYVSQMGTLMTDFTLIKPGALHRANGGYLIIDAQKVLNHAFAWDGLKRALKAGCLKIESLEEMLSLASTVSLEPQSIPLRVKVILTGEPMLYYLLKEYDDEFSELFKVEADFSEDTPRDDESTVLYSRLVAGLAHKHELRPLHRDAVARLIEQASRLAEDSEKFSLHVGTLADLMQESDYWAGRENADLVGLGHVVTAIEKRRYRQDRYREMMLEQVVRGVRFIDTGGARVGQVNGLSVLQVGDYSFGQPSRITATARLGSAGVIDIEREAKLGGELHSKGVLILSALLASRFASDRPLPLSASLVFEQSYGMVDGDSASAVELCALLSALGNVPLSQALAVTGSINQLGEIQPIGGVNEKIEGFFEVCEAAGLSGIQGVIIPASNRVHLMLDQRVRDAVAEGRFRIFSAARIEDVMELLSGLEAGTADAQGRYPPESFNGRVQQAVDRLLERHRFYAVHDGAGAELSLTHGDEAR